MCRVALIPLGAGLLPLFPLHHLRGVTQIFSPTSSILSLDIASLTRSVGQTVEVDCWYYKRKSDCSVIVGFKWGNNKRPSGQKTEQDLKMLPRVSICRRGREWETKNKTIEGEHVHKYKGQSMFLSKREQASQSNKNTETFSKLLSLIVVWGFIWVWFLSKTQRAREKKQVESEWKEQTRQSDSRK